MRPITLTFSGLRSYRATTTIDFENLDLFAVIGDTGAGKSTIIEALCLALYAKKSWSGGAKLEQLISDGEKLMRIELRFAAAGEIWEVTRARSRSGAGGVDKLVSLSGGRGADGASPVTERVTEIIGLNYDQFTRAVVLPQGRFDSMLQAGEKERNAILTSILDLEDVVATRTHVEKLKAHWAPKLSGWVADRAHYPADPAAALQAATDQASTAAARAEKLGAVVQEADGLAATAQALDAARSRLRDALDAEAEVTLDGSEVERLDGLHTRWVELAAAAATATQTADAANEALRALGQKMTETLAGFANRDELVTTRNAMNHAVDALPAVFERLGGHRTRVAHLEANPPKPEVSLELVAGAAETKQAAQVARLAFAAAERAVDDGGRLCTSLETARTRVTTAKEAVSAKQGLLEQAERDAKPAAKSVAAAEKAVAAARSRHADALVADAVATASAGCEPGDGCPICTRPLPGSFVPEPPSVDSTAAEQAVTKAEVKLRDAQAAAQQVATVLAGHAADLERLLSEVTESSDAYDVARQASIAAEVDVEARDVEVATAVLIATRDAARNAVAEAEEQAASAADAVARGQAEAEAEVTAHATALAAARESLASDESTFVALTAAIDGLPDAWPRADRDLLDRAMHTAAALGAALDALDAIDLDRASQSAELQTAQERVGEISTQVREEIRDPVAVALQRINHHLTAVRRIIVVLDLSAPALGVAVDRRAPLEDLDDAANPEDLADRISVASVAHERAVAVRTEGGQMLATADATAQETATKIAALLADVECVTVDALRVEMGAANERQGNAAAQLHEAQTAATRATALDEILEIARPFAANLEVLAVALRDQYFIAHLVDAREAELLAEASRRLKAITKGRFGFVADFGVVSIASGEVRTADTLSGGERFQAALALALALVEIASRGGGRLDAVFIDEGFGSLDSNALDVALDTLGLVSGDGKMVALISHLRPVAEYVDTVLHVTKDDTLGSRIELLDAESRDQMLAEDTRSGLTA